MICLLAISALAADQELPDDDLTLERSESTPAAADKVPHPGAGLRLTGGIVSAQTPAAGAGALSLALRPTPGLRVEVAGEAWLGPVWAPQREEQLWVLLPTATLGAYFEASTRSAVRPWIGASGGASLVVASPAVFAAVVRASAGIDLGRGPLGWTASVSLGASVSPTLPQWAGSPYDPVAPVVGVQTGPTVHF